MGFHYQLIRNDAEVAKVDRKRENFARTITIGNEALDQTLIVSSRLREIGRRCSTKVAYGFKILCDLYGLDYTFEVVDTVKQENVKEEVVDDDDEDDVIEGNVPERQR